MKVFKKLFQGKFLLVCFFLLFILLYFQTPLIQFFFLVPLYLYLKLTKKLNYTLIIFLTILTAFINFLPFVDFGTKYFVALLSSLLVFIFLFIYFANYFINKKYAVFTISGIFYLLFIILGLTPIANYWLNLAGFLQYFPISIRYIGSFGILILILFFNYILFELIWNYIYKKKNSKYTIILLIVLLINFLILPFISFDNYETNTKLNVVAIQGNLDQDWGERLKNRESNFKKYINLSNIAIKKHFEVQLIVWPEYTFTHEIEFDLELLYKLKNYSLTKNITLVVGSLLLENKTSISSKRYDTLYIFDKGNLLLYNAYVPVSIFDSDVVATNKNIPINVQNTQLGFALCYEENFEEVFTKQISHFNPKFFILTGNQFLVKNRRGLELISLNANLRAAEFNRYIVRLGNTGLSKIIDNTGFLVDEVPINSEQILYSQIPLIKTKTFYSKYKTSIDIFYMILFLLLGLGSLRHNKY